jgi:hypothetical protein
MLIGIVKAEKAIRIAWGAPHLRTPLPHKRTLCVLLTTQPHSTTTQPHSTTTQPHSTTTQPHTMRTADPYTWPRLLTALGLPGKSSPRKRVPRRLACSSPTSVRDPPHFNTINASVTCTGVSECTGVRQASRKQAQNPYNTLSHLHRSHTTPSVTSTGVSECTGVSQSSRISQAEN